MDPADPYLDLTHCTGTLRSVRSPLAASTRRCSLTYLSTMKCALYARVSTDRQAEKDLSIPAQLQLMRDFVRRQNWTIIEEFIEPGETATTMADRAVLQEMLRRIQSGDLNIDTVVAHKLNRVSRNLEDYVPLRALLAKHHVRLTYVVEKIDDTPSGRLLDNIMASIAQFESANLSDETKKGMRQKVLNGGWPHKPPRGYVVARGADERRKGSHVEIHPREGPLIAEAFALFACGRLSVETVAKQLAQKGLKSSRGRPISHSYLRRILTNPFYIGRLHWNDLDVDGEQPALVDRATFERVQQTLKERFVTPMRFRTTFGFPLKGLARCSRCRGHLTAERHGRFEYYRCSRKANRSELCDARYCRADRAHGDVKEVLRTLQLTRQTADQIAREAFRLIEERIRTADRTRRDLEQTLSGIVGAETKVTDAFLGGHIPSSVYHQKSHALRSERDRAQQQIASLTVPRDVLKARVVKVLDFSTSVFDLYDQFTEPRRSELLRAVFSGIVLGADGLVGFRLRPPFDTIKNGESAKAPAQDVLRAAEADDVEQLIS